LIPGYDEDLIQSSEQGHTRYWAMGHGSPAPFVSNSGRA